MRRSLRFFTSLLSLVCATSAWAVPETAKLTIEKAVHDFGRVDEGATVEAPFVIRNDGGAPLELQRIVPACGCTTVASEAGKNSLKPGESLTLNVKFDTAGFSGQKTKTVRVYTNDPLNPSGVITLRGEITGEFTVQPPRAFFGDVRSGTERSIDVLVKSRNSATKLGEVASRSEYLEVSKEASADGIRIQVRLKPTAPVGILRSTVTVQTSSANEPVLAFPVFAKVQGDLQFSPTYLSFDLLEGPLEAPVSKEVELKNVADDSPKIVEVRSSNPLVTGQVREIQAGKLFEVTATIAAGAQGVVRAQLTLTTDRADEERRTVVLPVYAVISKKGD